jgi:hypothetical protein
MIYFLKSSLGLLRASMVAENEGKTAAFIKVLPTNAEMFLLNLTENGQTFGS